MRKYALKKVNKFNNKLLFFFFQDIKKNSLLHLLINKNLIQFIDFVLRCKIIIDLEIIDLFNLNDSSNIFSEYHIELLDRFRIFIKNLSLFRIPSSFCGIYGLKTTCGRFSDDGQCKL